jgi:lipopolysaccharide export system protein LptA
VKKSVILFGAMVCFGTVIHAAQQKSPSGAKSSVAAKTPASKQTPTPAKQGSAAGAQSNDLLGDSNGRPQGPTEITATQEAQFDVKTRSGIFIGNVKVVDPQFTLTSNRLTVHLNKDEDGGGLNEAEAQGNVVIVHVNQPKTPAQPAQNAVASTPAARSAAAGPTPASSPVPAQTPTTSVGKAENAVYLAKDGSITLTGWPQVTQGLNTHIATAPGVKMVIYKDGKMQTYGSTRTLIVDRTGTNTPNANGAQ